MSQVSADLLMNSFKRLDQDIDPYLVPGSVAMIGAGAASTLPVAAAVRKGILTPRTRLFAGNSSNSLDYLMARGIAASRLPGAQNGIWGRLVKRTAATPNKRMLFYNLLPGVGLGLVANGAAGLAYAGYKALKD